MELLPFPNPPGHSDSPLLNMASHKSPQSSLFHGARRASLYPSMINEPIVEEDNEDDTEITEGACLSTRGILHALLGSGCRCCRHYPSVNGNFKGCLSKVSVYYRFW